MQIAVAFFIVCSIWNLMSLWREDQKSNRISKPLLMPLLIVVYLLSGCQVDFLVVAALFFGFLGDTFLLGSGNFFLLGLVSFLIGQLCYIAAFLTQSRLSLMRPAVFAVLLPYLFYSFVVCRALLPSVEKKMYPAVIFYMVCLLAMSFAAFTAMYCGHTGGRWIFAGSLFFVASDSILAFQTFQKNRGKYVNVLIMLTYLIAQSLIVYGMVH